MPILDPHHHFWERPGDVYLLDDLLADTRSRPPGEPDGVRRVPFAVPHRWAPEEMRSVGEVEFVEGIAAANASAANETAVAAAIVGNADMMLGDAGGAGAGSAGRGRQRTVSRDSLYRRLGRQPGDNDGAGQLRRYAGRRQLPPGAGLPGADGAGVRLHRVPPATAGGCGHSAGLSRTDYHPEPRGPPAGHRAVRRDGGRS